MKASLYFGRTPYSVAIPPYRTAHTGLEMVLDAAPYFLHSFRDTLQKVRSFYGILPKAEVLMKNSCLAPLGAVFIVELDFPT